MSESEQQHRNPLYARMTRRRALAVTGWGVTGIAAASLIGCSSSTKPDAAATKGNAAVATAFLNRERDTYSVSSEMMSIMVDSPKA